jgi:hypothetical protein
MNEQLKKKFSFLISKQALNENMAQKKIKIIKEKLAFAFLSLNFMLNDTRVSF